MDIEQVRTLVTQKSGKPPQKPDEGALGKLVDGAAHPDVIAYLRYCLPFETYLASEVRVLPWKVIVEEMGEGSAPGSFIRPFGYLIVASSVGGNVLCLHQKTGRVFWTDHTSFSDDMIMFRDQGTGSWAYLDEWTPTNVGRAMVPISENMETFLTALLTDQLTARLDALD